MTKFGVFAVVGALLMPCAAHAQNIIKVSPDRNTVTVTSQKGTATSTIVRDGKGGGTITTRYQRKESYQPMGSGGYQPMGSGR
jgi:hypothetical protein